jgi:hypothetical protein
MEEGDEEVVDDDELDGVRLSTGGAEGVGSVGGGGV